MKIKRLSEQHTHYLAFIIIASLLVLMVVTDRSIQNRHSSATFSVQSVSSIQSTYSLPSTQPLQECTMYEDGTFSQRVETCNPY